MKPAILIRQGQEEINIIADNVIEVRSGLIYVDGEKLDFIGFGKMYFEVLSGFSLKHDDGCVIITGDE